MKVAVSQIDLYPFDFDANVFLICREIERASHKTASLLLLPELAFTAYSMESAAAFDPHGVYSRVQKTVDATGVTVIAGSVEKSGDSSYNVLIRFSPGEHSEQLLYRKTHLFKGEEKLFSKGSTLSPFSFEEFTAFSHICYDLRFPALTQSVRQANGDLLFISAAWPKSRIEHWRTLLKARAAENQLYVVASNRCGCDDGLELGGYSAIIAPDGSVLAEASNEAAMIVADIFPQKVRECREALPFWNDRRPDLYSYL